MFADGSLVQCSHLMVPLCIVVCPVGARLTAACGAALCPVALLLAFLPILGSFFFCWHAHRCWCAAPPPKKKLRIKKSGNATQEPNIAKAMLPLTEGPNKRGGGG